MGNFYPIIYSLSLFSLVSLPPPSSLNRGKVIFGESGDGRFFSLFYPDTGYCAIVKSPAVNAGCHGASRSAKVLQTIEVGGRNGKAEEGKVFFFLFLFSPLPPFLSPFLLFITERVYFYCLGLQVSRSICSSVTK